MKTRSGCLTPSTRPTVPVVLLGGALNSLSAGRTLWRAGVPVDALAASATESALKYSRSVRRYIAPDDSMTVAESWWQWLANDAEPSMLLPCSDDGTEFIAHRRAKLESLGHRPVEANDDVLLAMLNKSDTSALATAAGVPVPRTVTVRSEVDFDEVRRFRFPAGLKPVHSHAFARHFRPDTKGVVIADADQAISILRPIVAESFEMLLTEMVVGSDECVSYYTYVDENGEFLFDFTKRKPRQYPTKWGLGSYHITSRDPAVVELGRQFFTSIGLRGVGNVEFKRDERDGQLKLIESNPRLTGANELVRAAGIDIARLAYARAVGAPLPAVDSYATNRVMWLPVDDMRAFREYRERGEWTTAAWTRSLLHRHTTTLFDWSDPAPAIRNWRARAAALARRFGDRTQYNDQGDSDPYRAEPKTPTI